jgi:hypothetical protein
VKTRLVFVIIACVGLVTPAAPLRAASVRERSKSESRLLTRAAPAPPLSNMRHRSPNPAVIAGSVDVGKRNAGALDGKQVHRRP